MALRRVAAAFLRRDFAQAAAYRLSFVLRLGSVLVALATVAYLARFVDTGGATLPARYGGGGYLGFFLLGLAVGEVFRVVSTSLAVAIREAQLEGTLEAMLSTPAPTAYVLFGASLFGFGGALFRLAAYLLAGQLLFGVTYGPVHATTVMLVVLLGGLAFLALGLLGGALTMTLRRSDPITALVAVAAVLIGGVLYPVDLLPFPLDELAYALPLAPALEAIRRALFAGATPADVGRELAWLGGFVLLVTPLAAWSFTRALRRAREDGSLGHY